jgi:NDP-sugar pyrophosphorylase family protein
MVQEKKPGRIKLTDKIVILAGGISSRMKKKEDVLSVDENLLRDADEKQKAMIGLGDNQRPFLDYLLYNIKKAGIKNVLVIIGGKDESIKNYYAANKKNTTFSGLNIGYAVQNIPSGRIKPAGTADALYQGLSAVPEWNGETFLVCNSDNLYSTEAMQILMNTSYPNAMIDYDRNGLLFESSRINTFAITKKDSHGFLKDIIEKPSDEIINEVMTNDGYIGVSMNLFKFTYDNIYHCLENTPYHPLRNEKELPASVKMMIDKNPDAVFTFRMNEHVPDLTTKKDIIPVQEYLKKEFSKKLIE